MTQDSPNPIKTAEWSGTLGRRSPRAGWPWIGGVLAVAAAARAVAVLAFGSQLADDPDAYRLIGENLARHGVLSRAPLESGGTARAAADRAPTAFRPPAYPALLAGLSRIEFPGLLPGGATPTKIAVLHVALGVLTVGLTMAAARRLLGPGPGPLPIAGAGLVTAVDPLLVLATAQVMTETLAAALTAGLMWLLATLIRRPPRLQASSGRVAGEWMALGLLFGVAVLARPVFLVWGGLVGVALLLLAARSALRRPRPTIDGRPGRLLVAAAGLAVGVAVPLGGWTARNAWQLGQPIAATTHGGYTLLLANNDHLYDHLLTRPWGTTWTVEPLEAEIDARTARPRDWPGLFDPAERDLPPEVRLDRAEKRWARETIGRRPGAFLLATLDRLARFWSPLPRSVGGTDTGGRASAREALRWPIAAWYGGVFLAAGVGTAAVLRRRGGRRGRAAWGLLLLGPLAFTSVHAVYWTDMRMRAPIMPIVAVLAVGLAAGRGRSGGRMSPAAVDPQAGYDGAVESPSPEPTP